MHKRMANNSESSSSLDSARTDHSDSEFDHELDQILATSPNQKEDDSQLAWNRYVNSPESGRSSKASGRTSNETPTIFTSIIEHVKPRPNTPIAELNTYLKGFVFSLRKKARESKEPIRKEIEETLDVINKENYLYDKEAFKQLNSILIELKLVENESIKLTDLYNAAMERQTVNALYRDIKNHILKWQPDYKATLNQVVMSKVLRVIQRSEDQPYPTASAQLAYTAELSTEHPEEHWGAFCEDFASIVGHQHPDQKVVEGIVSLDKGSVQWDLLDLDDANGLIRKYSVQSKDTPYTLHHASFINTLIGQYIVGERDGENNILLIVDNSTFTFAMSHIDLDCAGTPGFEKQTVSKGDIETLETAPGYNRIAQHVMNEPIPIGLRQWLTDTALEEELSESGSIFESITNGKTVTCFLHQNSHLDSETTKKVTAYTQDLLKGCKERLDAVKNTLKKTPLKTPLLFKDFIMNMPDNDPYCQDMRQFLPKSS